MDSIKFADLSLEEKIAQMIFASGDTKNMGYTSIGIGGIFLGNQIKPEKYKRLSYNFQKNSKIKLLIAADMEGAWSPFKRVMLRYALPLLYKIFNPRAQEGYNFPAFSEITSAKEAYEVAKKEGNALKETGFNMSFSPVAEYVDNVYGKRVFIGSKKEIEKRLKAYIEGFNQTGILSTAKHYPGKYMVKDNLHLKKSRVEITKDDLDLFKTCINANVSAIMIGHHIVYGIIDSKNKPSSVSREVIDTLKKFKGLIIADEITMYGIKSKYLFNKIGMYRDLINAGNHMILDFFPDPGSFRALIREIAIQTKKGTISQQKIDESVRRILTIKGYKVV